MLYCIHCGKPNKNEEEGVCKYCGQPLVQRDLDNDEIRTLSKALHTRDNVSREKVDNAMVFIVLGSTFLIIGFLFFFLSFKMNMDTYNKELTYKCFEFWVSMAGLGAGGFMLIWGLVHLIFEKAVVQTEVRRALRNIQNNNYDHLSYFDKK